LPSLTSPPEGPPWWTCESLIRLCKGCAWTIGGCCSVIVVPGHVANFAPESPAFCGGGFKDCEKLGRTEVDDDTVADEDIVDVVLVAATEDGP